MNTINPQYVMARRRADRRAAKFAQPHLAYPAYQRHALKLLKPKRRNLDKDHVVATVCVIALVSLFFVGGPV